MDREPTDSEYRQVLYRMYEQMRIICEREGLYYLQVTCGEDTEFYTYMQKLAAQNCSGQIDILQRAPLVQAR
jgi:hypothetical protein